MELIEKKALITGGAKRVGRVIALELAKKGVHIVLHYNHSENDAHQTRVAVEAQGVQCTLVRADLARPMEVRQMLAALPPVDILVNSASLFFKTPIESVSEADWDRLVDANLKGPFLLSTAIGKRMAVNQGGKIVNIADWSGFRPYKDYSAYCTSKGGLITLTRALARDLAPKVTVNAVAPGPVLMPPDMSDTEKEAIAKTTALGRWGKPEDVAHAVTFLLENDFISGTVLVVDGGRSIV